MVAVKKLSFSFHRTFALSRPAIAQIIRHSSERAVELADGDLLPIGALMEGGHLGTAYIEAMPRYARGSGLLRSDNRLTRFGRLAFANDSTLASVAVQWLMHYHLSAPHRPGPVFWVNALMKCFRVGDVFNKDPVIDAISACQVEGGAVTPAVISEAATAFLGTYYKPDALGPLGLLLKTGSNSYEVKTPDEPPAAVFAYAVADYWDGVWGERRTVNLDSVTTEQGGPASLLLLGTGQANRLLREMQSQGLVEIHRKSAPYTVVRLWDDTSELLEKVFE